MLLMVTDQKNKEDYDFIVKDPTTDLFTSIHFTSLSVFVLLDCKHVLHELPK